MAYIIRTLFASSTRGAYLELNSVFQPRFSSMALDEYIKATLKDVYDNKKTRDSNMWDSKYSNTFNANDDKTIILLIFDIIKDYKVKWIVQSEDEKLFNRLKNYYSEYKKYYILIR